MKRRLRGFRELRSLQSLPLSASSCFAELAFNGSLPLCVPRVASPHSAVFSSILLALLLSFTSCQSDVISLENENDEFAPTFSETHGLKDAPFTLSITPLSKKGAIYYTLDGSKPTVKSTKYTGPISVSGTTIIRAVEKLSNGGFSKVATASYLFYDDVLDLTSTPAGYPKEWGPYSQIEGTAKADYEMDPLMTRDPVLREKMKAGLRQIPIVSIVTDKDNLFLHSEDPDKGGIYIHTGAPVGDMTGRGWERPVSVEIFDGESLDATVDCAIKIHGGHSRLAEKNPKHAFRLKFKSEYGPSKLKCAVFGESGPSKYNTLTLRTFFGNSWQHWVEGNRRKAQYVRDMWSRMASAQLGMPYSNGRHVHVFLNGMYWGIYCLSERIDEYYCKTHFGGEETDYDVLKVDESQGNSVVADYGSYAKYAELIALKGTETMAEIERLLDVDEFIDFMILNQYGGNTDWDYHNWFAIRDSKGGGFRFLVWDSEGIFISLDDNVLDLGNSGKPTGIFKKMMKNPDFQKRFADRVRELSSPGGLLTPEKTVALWDSLYHSIDMALYCEAARWGDYRNSVHPYSSKGQRFDVDNWYMQERGRLMSGYFPNRLDTYLQQLREKGWYPEE